MARGTKTSNFGVGARESHDASGFYARFQPPTLSDDETVLDPVPVAEPFVCGDARSMHTVADGSVALVVTSPPYFAGKQYEEELDAEGVPSSYLEYLELLRDVFADCVRALEPGGRLAVNVANLGRKPYRSLSADVLSILGDDLGLLLRGEIVWRKSEGASGNCAWGSFRSASNPVLRDLTERVVVASKGRFDRALGVKQRAARGLPHRNTLPADDFMASTLDVWTIPPASANRIGHPAPFPVDLPAQLIRLYTFENDLVLDPFMGSGSTLVAASTLGRRYVGYDLDPDYVALTRERVAATVPGSALVSDTGDEGEHPTLVAAGRLAQQTLTDVGFTITATGKRVGRAGTSIDVVANDTDDRSWSFLVAGPNLPARGGMVRTDVVWRTIGQAAALRGHDPDTPVVVLTTGLPTGDGDKAVRAAGRGTCFDVIDLLDDDAVDRLRRYAKGGTDEPLLGYWS